MTFNFIYTFNLQYVIYPGQGCSESVEHTGTLGMTSEHRSHHTYSDRQGSCQHYLLHHHAFPTLLMHFNLGYIPVSYSRIFKYH